MPSQWSPSGNLTKRRYYSLVEMPGCSTLTFHNSGLGRFPLWQLLSEASSSCLGRLLLPQLLSEASAPCLGRLLLPQLLCEASALYISNIHIFLFYACVTWRMVDIFIYIYIYTTISYIYIRYIIVIFLHSKLYEN